VTAPAGLLLAAGAGSRMGLPKALLAHAGGRPRVSVAVEELRAAGCAPVAVVLGAAGDRAAGLLDPDPELMVLTAEDWAEGIGASLRAGLAALEQRALTALGVLVTLVDLPDVGAPVMRRVVGRWAAGGCAGDALVRATYDGRPGHPVLIGRAHWAPLLATLAGDVGAQRYLAGRAVQEVPCADLATGRDLDRPQDVAP